MSPAFAVITQEEVIVTSPNVRITYGTHDFGAQSGIMIIHTLVRSLQIRFFAEIVDLTGRVASLTPNVGIFRAFVSGFPDRKPSFFIFGLFAKWRRKPTKGVGFSLKTGSASVSVCFDFGQNTRPKTTEFSVNEQKNRPRHPSLSVRNPAHRSIPW